MEIPLEISSDFVINQYKNDKNLKKIKDALKSLQKQKEIVIGANSPNKGETLSKIEVEITILNDYLNKEIPGELNEMERARDGGAERQTESEREREWERKSQQENNQNQDGKREKEGNNRTKEEVKQKKPPLSFKTAGVSQQISEPQNWEELKSLMQTNIEAVKRLLVHYKIMTKQNSDEIDNQTIKEIINDFHQRFTSDFRSKFIEIFSLGASMKDNLLKIIEETIQEIKILEKRCGIDLPELENKIQTLKNRILVGFDKVLILGPQNVGKSCVANVIIGNEILESRTGQITDRLWEITDGPKSLSLKDKDRRRPILGIQWDKIKSLENLEFLKNYRPNRDEYYSLTYPCPLLKNVKLYDSPGLYSNALHSKLVWEFLPNVVFVILVVDSGSEFSFDFEQEFFARFKAAELKPEQLLVVHTKLDAFDKESEKEKNINKVISTVVSNLPGWNSRTNYCTLNGVASTASTKFELADEETDTFFKLLSDQLDSALNPILQHAFKTLSQSLELLVSLTNAEITRFRANAENSKKKQQQLQKVFNEWNIRKSDLQKFYDEEIESVKNSSDDIKHFEESVEQAILKLTNWTIPKSDKQPTVEDYREYAVQKISDQLVISLSESLRSRCGDKFALLVEKSQTKIANLTIQFEELDILQQSLAKSVEHENEVCYSSPKEDIFRPLRGSVAIGGVGGALLMGFASVATDLAVSSAGIVFSEAIILGSVGGILGIVLGLTIGSIVLVVWKLQSWSTSSIDSNWEKFAKEMMKCSIRELKQGKTAFANNLQNEMIKYLKKGTEDMIKSLDECFRAKKQILSLEETDRNDQDAKTHMENSRYHLLTLNNNLLDHLFQFVNPFKLEEDTVDVKELFNEGASSKVHRAKLKGENVVENVVAKKLSKPDVKSLFWECSALSRLSHPNVVRFYGLVLKENDYYIVLESLDRALSADLLNLHQIRSRSTPQFHKINCNILRQIAVGLHHIHQQGYIHRDLKLDNILLKGNISQNEFTIKIGDFGSAKLETLSNGTLTGTETFIAPESTRGFWSFGSDIYSIGIIVWQLFHPSTDLVSCLLKGSDRFQPHVEQISLAAQRLASGERPDIEQQTPEIVHKTITSCWSHSVANRPSALSIIEFMGDWNLELLGKASPKPAPVRPLRVLALDGGGSRGVIMAVILAEILKISGANHISELFDLIGGTSTGGILALALFLRKFSIDDCQELYFKIAKTVFAVPFSSKVTNLFYSQVRYDANKLKEELDKSFLNQRMTKSTNKVFAVTKKDGFLHLLRNYSNDSSPNPGVENWTLSDAARATSAAPTYFEPLVISKNIYVDGGIGYNNPTVIAIDEARTLTGVHHSKAIAICVSLGCGSVSEQKKLIPRDVHNVMGMLINEVSSSERVHEYVSSISKEPNASFPYFRFSPIIQDDSLDIGAEAKLQELITITQKYLTQAQVSEDIKKVCALLKQ